MCTPLNRFFPRNDTFDEMTQPMLNRNRRFRYDLPFDDLEWPDIDLESVYDYEEPEMDVKSAGTVGEAGSVQPVHLTPAEGAEATRSTGLQAPQDEVQISSAARALDQLQADPQVREARLAEIRAAIDHGVYETPEKLEAAVDRMIESLNRDA